MQWRRSGIPAGGPVRRAAAFAVLAVLAPALAGCAATVPGTPWPAGAGPAWPAEPVAEAPTTQQGPPTSFTGPADRLPVPDPMPAPTPDATGEAAPTRTVLPVPVDDTATGTPTEPPTGTATGTGSATGSATRARPGRTAHGGAPAGGAAPLTADVLDDECLLGPDALAGLLGAEPAVPAAGAQVARPDGTRTRACFAVGGSATAAVNVYTTNRGTPADHIRSTGGARGIGGTGDGIVAVLLETVAGPTVQIGTERYLVTIAVAGRNPSDDQWRIAVRDAVSALPG
ncbi:hypothetical protein C8E95_1220 [Pseudonocardia autotrophica]|uniref:DUF3558 domain-containing protein n=2 Tax=Pseudonocardia TaxID=1847 RepID=A0A1Y2MJF8_PSEAH|nr:hypothetical protein BG845_06052 [Pseudonocardia autotrophica]TDN72168.1 hypothetical protein C8E95_1220 [Pseudonocardia autotrophica]BBG02874.1 hypothetical protein Pdca_40830 [Pseudonocardia autotrophica]GEC27662.1 hypothetical protein PSA01_46910 [Pseudonocardia saturnea]